MEGIASVDVSRLLLCRLHPTPAVGGLPRPNAVQFIRRNEGPYFDRGYYAGPFGYISPDDTDVAVSIRSALLSSKSNKIRATYGTNTCDDNTRVLVYAGAGIVPGSTAEGEWMETSHKLGVISSLFPASPVTLQNAPNANSAWATAFIEELIRNGVVRFYICPGSRSTPLTVAIARATRTHLGEAVEAISVHDERGAGFRALGYGRSTGKPAVVITSSGTAVANLYPAVVEAGLDGVPLLLLTADRPYENRDTGANQAIDQVKAFSSSYIRWFRDILPPSDDVPVSACLSDANHAVAVSRDLMGPVHINVQFRENLAPDAGPIRNDNRVDSLTRFHSSRFTDVPGFLRWSLSGGSWSQSYYPSESGNSNTNNNGVIDVANLILQSKRGIIVVGNIRSPGVGDDLNALSHFAQSVGFPVLAGVQSAFLRHSPSVVPFAEHVLKHPAVRQNLKPDLILQIGAPLVSTEFSGMIADSMRVNGHVKAHVLIHNHRPAERSDPDLTVTHRVSSDAAPFLYAVLTRLKSMAKQNEAYGNVSSELAPLVLLGRELEGVMPDIIHKASEHVFRDDHINGEENDSSVPAPLTEPQVTLAVSEVLSEKIARRSQLFLSNSMPVRDAEFFLYPRGEQCSTADPSLSSVAVNRGASGIDGIISTAAGFADAAPESHTTLIVGDLTALHDINALHTLARSSTADHNLGPPNPTAPAKQNSPSLTTVVVNNEGGGIFSFLPIAKYGDSVRFEDFFGTSTHSYSFKSGAESFGLPFQFASSYESFKKAYRTAMISGVPNILEAKVVDRQSNVAVHAEISRLTKAALDDTLNPDLSSDESSLQQLHSSEFNLPAKIYRYDQIGKPNTLNGRHGGTKTGQKTLLLLHGWMGDKADWNKVASSLIQKLPSDWEIVSVDLPGHGESPLLHSDHKTAIRNALGLGRVGLDGAFEEPSEHNSKRVSVNNEYSDLSIDAIAKAVMFSLKNNHSLGAVDAVCGYSLGGRVALAMARLSLQASQTQLPKIIAETTQMILLGSYPGSLPLSVSAESLNIEDSVADSRREADDELASKLERTANAAYLDAQSESSQSLRWSAFLSKWYGVESLWGGIQTERSPEYQIMVEKRAQSLSKRGMDLAAVLRSCSPARNSDSDWRFCPSKTLFVAGSNDKKYSKIGRQWSRVAPSTSFIEIPDAGHALLVEAPSHVADIIHNYLTTDIATYIRPTPPKPDTATPLSSSRASLGMPLTSGTKGKEPASTSMSTSLQTAAAIGGLSVDYEMFAIETKSNDKRSQGGILGIGWGSQAIPNPEKKLRERRGFIINLVSSDGTAVGIGEVSPLPGLHEETPEEAENQLMMLQERFNSMQQHQFPPLQPELLLRLDGSLSAYLVSLIEAANKESKSTIELVPSVRSGLEMALLSLASQASGLPLPQALLIHSHFHEGEAKAPSVSTLLPLNGMQVRGSAFIPFTSVRVIGQENTNEAMINFPSMKVKVGHQNTVEDAQAIINGLASVNQFSIDDNKSRRAGRVRADANRAWTKSDALAFVASLDVADPSVKTSRFEFIEEPLKKQISSDGEWTLSGQIQALEDLYRESAMPFALDESLADAAQQSSFSFQVISEQLRDSLTGGNSTGCAALVLKPALLGLELSMQLARFAHEKLGIGAVFSSSFDSGVGLAYTAILGAASDSLPYATSLNKYPHGIGTFQLLAGDTMSPPFRTYVKHDGMLNIAPLARALYGLGLDELRDAFTLDDSDDINDTRQPSNVGSDNYQAVASTSSSGREIKVEVSLPLPFSDEIASSRFTDLPQQSRWSPWLNSVAYLDDGKETEWTLNVRGVQYRWRAVSTLIENPKGIMWESVSGLKNKGVVLFMPSSEDSCLMKVKMSIITPRFLASVFRGTSAFVEDFLENKLLKWSLEMFRDVVKADLALERGDAELGDALFGAVEGKANAIEATLSYTSSIDSLEDKQK